MTETKEEKRLQVFRKEGFENIIESNKNRINKEIDYFIKLMDGYEKKALIYKRDIDKIDAVKKSLRLTKRRMKKLDVYFKNLPSKNFKNLPAHKR